MLETTTEEEKELIKKIYTQKTKRKKMMKKFSEFLDKDNVISEEFDAKKLNKDISTRDVRHILFDMNGRDTVYLNGKRMTADNARSILFQISEQDEKICKIFLHIEY